MSRPVAAPGAVGQCPASSTARAVMPPSDPAWISGTFPGPALAGRAGRDPATSPSGSDQSAWYKLNGTRCSADPMIPWSAALSGAD